MMASAIAAPKLTAVRSSIRTGSAGTRGAPLSAPRNLGKKTLQLGTSAAHPRRNTVQCGLFGLGGPELLVIGGVAALLFGPSRLPELGKSVGKTVKSFQSAAEEFKNEVNKAATEDDEAETPAVPPAAPPAEEQKPKSE
mmetsp:Transcript_3597/g.12906  ORF Transcript_3597/g.12906 Transcript_3597/m.12906 type:complete len:139 (+) Transcript_3597:63-479(+)